MSVPRLRSLLLITLVLGVASRPAIANIGARPHEDFLRQQIKDVLDHPAADVELKAQLKEAIDRYDAKFSFIDRIWKTLKNPWVIFGFAAQAMFMMRFVLQWIASERRQRSYVPVAFWYFSLLGGLMLLGYALRQQDLVFTFGQALGCIIYIRNLALIYRRKKTLEATQQLRARHHASLAEELMEDGLESPTQTHE
ncbi:MAG: hypothetical protein HJJLKODD_01358 [Phycisphaerae bacterium]|nr:hypothetical protein [Phycisphaerae bacterium]